MTTTAPPQPYTLNGQVPVPQDHLAPGARIRARGVPITLADGSTRDLRYGMAGLLALEQTFGSLGAARDTLQGMNDQRPVLTHLTALLSCGLVHTDLGGPEQDYATTRRALIQGDLLDPSNLQEYGTAAGQAFSQAFPASPGNDAGAETPTPPAPGPTGTTSAP